MVSSSGKDPDDHIQEPIHGRGQREDSRASTSTVAAGASLPPPPPPPLPPPVLPQLLGHCLPPLRIREQSEDGRRCTEGSSSYAAEVDRKGKKVVTVLSPVHSLSSSSGSSPLELYATEHVAGTSSSREGRGLELQQVKSTQVKKTLWSKLINYGAIKILGRKGRHVFNQNSRESLSSELSKRPHVDRQKAPFNEALIHYFDDLKVSVREGVMPMNVVELQYSKFRPVARDGESFYRSFIFSYLEQVLAIQHTHEEHRLLSSIESVAIQCVHLGWTSEFFRSYIPFNNLIMKVMKWKRQGRWLVIASTNSYCNQKLLDFFSTYDTTEDIFAFLRIVAALWICSHREEFEHQISGLREDYSLKDWCLQNVIPPRVLTDDVQMTALARALDVPLVVELLRVGTGKIIYSRPGVPPVLVTLLFTGNHYDIIYR